MGGAPTPKWDPIGFDPQPYIPVPFACPKCYRKRFTTSAVPEANFGSPSSNIWSFELLEGHMWVGICGPRLFD